MLKGIAVYVPSNILQSMIVDTRVGRRNCSTGTALCAMVETPEQMYIVLGNSPGECF